MNNNTITKDMRPVAIRYMDTPKVTNAEIHTDYGKLSGNWGDYRYGEKPYIILRNCNKDYNLEFRAKKGYYRNTTKEITAETPSPYELRDDEIPF